MLSLKKSLHSTTLIPAFIGAGLVVAGAADVQADNGLLPMAKPKPAYVEIAACNPCKPKGCNPCNPCAAKKACNPCAAKKGCNPCNPCGGRNPCAAGGGSVSAKCFVPRLASAACNPCAAKKGCSPCKPKRCNPCAAKKGCNPCAAKNPCNPCAAKNPCNPCAAKNPCNPCGGCNPCAAAEYVEITPAEAQAVYDCLKPDMVAGYAKSSYGKTAGYTGWVNVAASPYASGTHGERYVNNYASPHGDYRYQQFEKAGTMPTGSVLAKDSFVIKANGKVSIGPMFIMEKMKAGSNKKTNDWHYVMIMPNGKVAGQTGSKSGISMQFCADCHNSAYPETDGLLLVPDEFRKKY